MRVSNKHEAKLTKQTDGDRGTLTAVRLIRSIEAVGDTVTSVRSWDAGSVGAGELRSGARPASCRWRSKRHFSYECAGWSSSPPHARTRSAFRILDRRHIAFLRREGNYIPVHYWELMELSALMDSGNWNWKENRERGTDADKLYSRQRCLSSDPSSQSSSSSQTQFCGMHSPSLRHWNWALSQVGWAVKAHLGCLVIRCFLFKDLKVPQHTSSAREQKIF